MTEPTEQIYNISPSESPSEVRRWMIALLARLHEVFPCHDQRHNISLQRETNQLALTIYQDDSQTWRTLFIEPDDVGRPIESIVDDIYTLIRLKTI